MPSEFELTERDLSRLEDARIKRFQEEFQLSALYTLHIDLDASLTIYSSYTYAVAELKQRLEELKTQSYAILGTRHLAIWQGQIRVWDGETYTPPDRPLSPPSHPELGLVSIETAGVDRMPATAQIEKTVTQTVVQQVTPQIDAAIDEVLDEVLSPDRLAALVRERLKARFLGGTDSNGNGTATAEPPTPTPEATEAPKPAKSPGIRFKKSFTPSGSYADSLRAALAAFEDDTSKQLEILTQMEDESSEVGQKYLEKIVSKYAKANWKQAQRYLKKAMPKVKEGLQKSLEQASTDTTA